MNITQSGPTAIAIIAVATGLIATGAAEAQTRELGSSGQLLDGIAAVADSGVVLKSEVERRLATVIDNYTLMQAELPPEERSALPPLAILEQQVLDQLINEELQVQRAERAGIVIGDDEVNEALAEIAARNGVTLAELPSLLATEGIDYASFREDQRDQLMIQALVGNDVMRRVASSISQRELEQCLARTETSRLEYNVSHILVSIPLNGGQDEIDAAAQRARDIVRELDEGADFAQLALTHSDSPSALDGGRLGWLTSVSLPDPFAEDVLAMQPGEHSTPIRAGSGFHIVKLNELRGAEPLFVDQLRVRHIMLRPNEVLDDDATMQKLIGIREQILEGEDFGTIAQAQSEDTTSAIDDGEIGWLPLSEFDEVFAGVLQSLEVGELSEPFRTPFGWHIAEIMERRTHDVRSERTEQNCRNQIGRAKLEEERELWEQRIRDEAFVVERL